MAPLYSSEVSPYIFRDVSLPLLGNLRSFLFKVADWDRDLKLFDAQSKHLNNLKSFRLILTKVLEEASPIAVINLFRMLSERLIRVEDFTLDCITEDLGVSTPRISKRESLWNESIAKGILYALQTLNIKSLTLSQSQSTRLVLGLPHALSQISSLIKLRVSIKTSGEMILLVTYL